jgi:hypothetical protein
MKGKRTVVRLKIEKDILRIEARTKAKRIGRIIAPPGSFMRKSQHPELWVKQMKARHGGRTFKLPKGGKRVLGYGAKEKVVYSQVGHPVHRTVAKSMRNIELHKKSWGNPLTANPKMGKTWKKAIDDSTWRKWKSTVGAKHAVGAAATGAGLGMVATGIRQKVTGKRKRVR